MPPLAAAVVPALSAIGGGSAVAGGIGLAASVGGGLLGKFLGGSSLQKVPPPKPIFPNISGQLQELVGRTAPGAFSSLAQMSAAPDQTAQADVGTYMAAIRDASLRGDQQAMAAIS